MKINLNNYEEYFFNAVENNLTTEERAEVDLFLALHPELQDEFAAWQNSVLVDEKEIVFSNKKALLKPESGRVISMFFNFNLWSAVAAGLLLLVLFKFLIPDSASHSAAIATNFRSIDKKNKTLFYQVPDSASIQFASQSNVPIDKHVAKNHFENNIKSIDTVHQPEVILAMNHPSNVQIHNHPRVLQIQYKTLGVALENVKTTEAENWFSVAGIALTHIWKLSGHADLFQNDNQLKLAANKTIDLTINTRLIKIQKRFSLFHKTETTKK